MGMNHRKWALPAVVAVGALGLVAGTAIGYLRAGVYDIGADDPHYPATYALLSELRDASIARRAGALDVPKDLTSPARVRQGAGNYHAMCTGCHLAPGMGPTELSRGLYPAPPNLSKVAIDPARAFWTIKHGIKASGMPAWGASMADEYIWNMAAFMQQLPKLDAASYRTLVASSGGHSHGGGEPDGDGHHHDDEMRHPHEDAAAGTAHDHEPTADAASPATHVDPPGAAPHHHDTPAKHVDPPGTPPHHHDAPDAPTS